jgi:hypothetical protein
MWKKVFIFVLREIVYSKKGTQSSTCGLSEGVVMGSCEKFIWKSVKFVLYLYCGSVLYKKKMVTFRSPFTLV